MDDIDKKIKELWHGVRKQDSGKERKSCPADTMLSHYIDGVLEETDRENIENHLVECNSCLDIVILHNKMSVKEGVEISTCVPETLMKKAMDLVTHKEEESKEGIFDIVLKFAKETIEIINNPGNLAISYGAMPVPVRGERQTVKTNIVTMHKTVSGIDAEIEVEKVGEGNVNISVMAKGLKYGAPAGRLRISLFNPDREIASYVADDGKAHFEGLPYGEYVVKINRQRKNIGQIGLVVR